MRWLAALTGLIGLLIVPSLLHAREGYRTVGVCDGLPRVAVTTPPGMCVGLAAMRIGFPRGLARIGSDVYVADLASRTPGRGRVVKLSNFGRGASQVILSGLNQPNGIAAAPDGTLYLGEVGRIIRFDPGAPNPRDTVRVVLDGLPQDGRHNLTSFALADDGALIVNVGSYSDNCEPRDGTRGPAAVPCPEFAAKPPRASLLRVDPATRRIETFATGLRNAMAMAFLADGTLVAASNSRDNIDSADSKLSDELLPHDVLMRIEGGAHYGWPYCFDMSRPSPEYPRYDCRALRQPTLLLPPHAAPLAMIRYAGTRLKGLQGALVIAYHGYRSRGHRIVAFDVGAKGSIGPREHNLVTGWTFRADVGPMGTPSALLELPDGSILIAEDQNRTLLRLSTQ